MPCFHHVWKPLSTFSDSDNEEIEKIEEKVEEKKDEGDDKIKQLQVVHYPNLHHPNITLTLPPPLDQI